MEGRRVIDDWPPRPLRWPEEPLRDGTVVLDRMTPRDTPALVAAIDDEILRWLPLPSPYTAADAADFLDWQRDSAELGTALNFALRQAVGGALVGSIGVHFRAGPGVAEIGYWVAPGARGRGLAVAATRLLARHTLATYRPRRVEVLVQPANAASLRVAERAGAIYEGVRRAGTEIRGEPLDVAVYAFVPGDAALDDPPGTPTGA
jgi:RimJ/RimL family protein N-acetyltransferase